jgi:hypothetical protein
MCGLFPYQQPILQTPTECQMIQFKFDMDHMQLALAISPTRLPLLQT